MAIKKCFVFVFIFVLISSFVFPAFAADTPYFYPDESQFVQLSENLIFFSDVYFSDALDNYFSVYTFDFSFQFDPDVQYYILYATSSDDFRIIPINCMFEEYFGTFCYTFGMEVFGTDYLDSFNLLYELGFIMIPLPDEPDRYVVGVGCDPVLSNQYGVVALSYLERDITISDRVNQGILLVVELLGTFVSSFFARSGDLYPLLQLLLLGISVSVLVWVARAIKIFIWGY